MALLEPVPPRHRRAYAVDAWKNGYLVGFREDGSFQLSEKHSNVSLGCGFLDNYFQDPDIKRYLEKFEEYNPRAAVVADAYLKKEAGKYNKIVEELQSDHAYKTFIVVPKCRDAFDALSEDIILGVPTGYSEIDPDDLGWRNYRGRDVHLFGGSPDKAYNAIQKLTQPNLAGDPPANVRGLDWNGFFRPALSEPGEYWTPNGWKKDSLASSTRETVRESLREVKAFWQENGVWPDTEPRDLYGPAVEEPDVESPRLISQPVAVCDCAGCT